MQKEYLATLMEDLKKLVTSETVIGDPILVQGNTIIPVVSITFGFGSGGNDASETGNSKYGMGAGAGAKVLPIAFLVVNGDQVTLLQVQNQKANNSLDRIVDLMPGLVDKVSNQFMKKKSNVTESAHVAAVKLVQDEHK